MVIVVILKQCKYAIIVINFVNETVPTRVMDTVNIILTDMGQLF